MLDATNKLKPQLDEALKLATNAIKAAESGKTADLVAPIKNGVCLLTKLATWLPMSFRQKIELYIALVGTYACSDPTASTTKAATIQDLRRLQALLIEIGAKG
jgi:hypothetical protein